MVSGQYSAIGKERPRVAIVGGGVCGLGIGWRLAAAGCPVSIFERGRAGRAASWAAAGMLAAGVETEPGEERLFSLTRRSQRRWPAFARELEAASGLPLGYRDEGTLVVALTRDDAARLEQRSRFQERLGVRLEWLSGADARRREPYLRSGLAGAVFSPDDHQVDNRLLVAALVRAFTAAGGDLREAVEVGGLDTAGGVVRGIRVDDRVMAFDMVVLAAGAWSAGLAGLDGAARPPVRPVKGQMLALRMATETPLLRHVLWSPGVYLVPRADGRLIVGGTVEEQGFDERLTAGGLYALLESARRVVPATDELAVDELWVGFRPTSRDDAPILGPGALEGLVLATGHHRNGILLAPVTADLVADYILTGWQDRDLEDFGPGRFASPTARTPNVRVDAAT